MNIISQVASKLEEHGIESSRVNAELMLGDILGCGRGELYINDIVLNPGQLKQLEEMVSRRINGEPLQYITGKTNFYGRELLIEPGVFIPRPETEILVDTVLNLITIYDIQRAAARISAARPASPVRNVDSKGGNEISNGASAAEKVRRHTIYEPLIFDIGTGSGNIAVSLTKALTHCKIISSDISETAIALAKRNASLHGLSGRMEFIKADLFDIPKRYKGLFDIIISNPPYIADEELPGLPFEIKKEPPQALDGGREGMSFYSRIIEGAPSFLKRDGIIALELADGIDKKVRKLFKDSGRFGDIRVFKDLNGIERVITAISYKL